MNKAARLLATWRAPAAVAAGVIAVAVAGAPAQAQAAVAGGWPQLQGSANHSGDEPGENSVTAKNVHQLKLAWQLPWSAGMVQSEVAVSGAVAYAIGGNDAGDDVVALNAAGVPLWERAEPQSLLGTPSVQGNLVIVAYDTGNSSRVVALNAATGAQQWQTTVGELQPASEAQGTTVTTAPGRAYLSLLDGRVDALSLTTGRLVWTSPVLPDGQQCGALSSPSVSGGLIIVGGNGENVTALQASDGQLVWSDAFPVLYYCEQGAESWTPAITGSTVYAGLQEGIAALSLSTGTVRWHVQSIGDVPGLLSVTGTEVIATIGTGQLTAFSLASGSVLWQTSASLIEDSPATFGGLTWAVGGRANSSQIWITAVSAQTGRLEYSAPITDVEQGFPPVVWAGHVYVLTGYHIRAEALPS
jgi:outer membrane protein assembly factor BamB